MGNTDSELNVYENHAKYYDVLYGGGGSKYLEFLQWLIEYLGIGKTEKILDMGSGTGRLLIPLTELGYTIEGMEPYSGMREVTLEKAANLGISVDLSEGSFQSLNALDKYSLIYSMDGTMAYLENTSDYKKAFANITQSLRKNGYFIVDMMNFYSLIKNYKYPETEEFSLGDVQVTALVHHEIDYTNEFWIHKSTLFVQKGETITKIEDRHKLNMISRKLLIELGRNAGLKVELLLNHIEDRPGLGRSGARNIILFRKI